MFRAIQSDNFPPFGALRMEFPPVENKPADLGEVQLFTGVNGTGKTRLLSLLAAMLGNPEPLARRLRGSRGETRFFALDTWPLISDRNRWGQMVAGGNGMPEWLPGLPGETVPLATHAVPAFAYSGVPYVSDAPVAAMANVERPSRVACLSFNRPEDSSQVLLQAITNLKLQAAMETLDPSSASASDPAWGATGLVKALESSLSQVTGTPFMFQPARFPKLVLGVRWGGVDLSFDVLPDGLRSVIGWMVHAVVMMDLWLQGKANPLDAEAIFLLDEIGSHLHPAWQRRILPAFQRLFPKAQIFVATHSPFVIASLNYGWIHPLVLGADGKAIVQKPVTASRGDSYVTVVEDIMGVKEWYDPETEKLLAEYRTARNGAFGGDAGARAKARELAAEIGRRSMELDYMMGRELAQMDRQMAGSASDT